MSGDPNRLLHFLSARKKTNWKQYRDAIAFMMPPPQETDSGLMRSSVLSGLLQCIEALGHCDSIYENGSSSITVSSPAICRLPRAGLPVAVLTGARSPATKKKLSEAVGHLGLGIDLKVESNPGPLGLLPDTIVIRAERESILSELCAFLNIKYISIPPAWTFAHWCGALPEYEESLEYTIPLGFNWGRFDFDETYLRFGHTIVDSLPRFSKFINPKTRLPLYVYFEGEYGAGIDPNWGRFLFLKSKGICVTAYDEACFKLCVPIGVPFPAIVARTLCLCSGKPPVHLANTKMMDGCEVKEWLMYEYVPPQIALQALGKLGQTPKRVQIG